MVMVISELTTREIVEEVYMSLKNDLNGKKPTKTLVTSRISYYNLTPETALTCLDGVMKKYQDR